jgi:hypothetical protein
VHEEGYQIARQADGALEFRHPDGRVLPDVPPAPVVPADPLQALRATNVGRGLLIDARTTCAGWLGERLNVGWAIDIQPARVRAAPAASGRSAPSRRRA